MEREAYDAWPRSLIRRRIHWCTDSAPTIVLHLDVFAIAHNHAQLAGGIR